MISVEYYRVGEPVALPSYIITSTGGEKTIYMSPQMPEVLATTTVAMVRALKSEYEARWNMYERADRIITTIHDSFPEQADLGLSWAKLDQARNSASNAEVLTRSLGANSVYVKQAWIDYRRYMEESIEAICQWVVNYLNKNP